MGETLNDMMEFGHVIRVLPGGEATDAEGVYAPEVSVQLDAEGSILPGPAGEPLVEGWELMTGYTGQYGYRGPIMHASEYVGGRMEEDILERPGLYVVVEVTGLYPTEEDEARDSDDPIGWVVARQEDA
jgi:hypothetical protein